MKKLIQVAMVAAALAVAPAAWAAPITGAISFAGGAEPTGGSTWATATGVNFVDCGICDPTKEAVVVSGSGSYAGTAGNFVDYTDFTFSPSLSPDPVSPLWTFTTLAGVTYSFQLDEVTINNQGVDGFGQSFLNLSGMGILTITGGGTDFSPTLGTFIFTGNESGGEFSFSSSDAALNVVPEPGSMLLLGTGLLGLAAVARRRMRKS